MKSIKTLFTAFIIMIAISSCDKLKEATLIETDVDFHIDVPLESPSAAGVANSASLKSIATVYTFSGYADFNLSNEKDLEGFINGIEKFEISSANCELIGLSGNNEILSATMSIKNKATSTQLYSFTLPGILTISSSSFTLDQLETLSQVLLDNKEITLKVLVDGTSNFPLVKGQHQLKTTINSKAYYTPLL